MKKGELLGTFDREAIKNAGYDDTVMILVTNSPAYSDISPLDKKNVAEGEDILAVSKAYEQ